ncbi:MAG TPA: response regulator transcription factor [Stellaceae bacterium]|nr:response regulator transcription factor [Stellaceae bacterium]
MEEGVGRVDTSNVIEVSTVAGPGPSAAAGEGVVAVIDQSRLRRECLRLALSQHGPQWRILEAATVEDLLRDENGETLDLVLIGAATSEHVDLRQIDTLRNARPETPVVVVAENDNPQRARHILSAGARGFLPASLSVKVLMGALELVLAGGVYVPSSLIETAITRPGSAAAQGPAGEPWCDLTRRQRDVLAMISQGKSNKLIADALTMSESTVKAHVKQIIKRLHVANRTQAALLATGGGVFPPPVNRNGALITAKV